MLLAVFSSLPELPPRGGTLSRIRPPLGLLSLIALVGCTYEPKGPPRFQIDPRQAAQAAMKLYDTNGDSKLDANELKASPPLTALLQNLKTRDPSHPDVLTEDDIAERIDEWTKAPTILVTGMAMVSLDDRPLEGATVTYEPEPFLGPSYRSHQGTTNAAGTTQLDPELPDYPGVYVGLYRVRISKKVEGKETLPTKYNTKTELGRELAQDIHDYKNSMFGLKSK